MTVERELEIGKWLKTVETELLIKPEQYYGLVELLDKFYNAQMKENGISIKYSKDEILDILDDSMNLDYAVKMINRLL